MIRITERPFSRRSRSSSRRMPAWTVTSSAVVGSSAISSFGRAASALAIAMRWRIPPENWCGNARSARSGSGIRTSSRSSRRAFDGGRLRRGPSWKRTCSVSCCRSVSIGWSEVSGSWKTIASSRAAHSARRRAAAKREQVAPADTRRARGARAGGQELHQREHRDRLAAAALAGDAEDLPSSTA